MMIDNRIRIVMVVSILLNISKSMSLIGYAVQRVRELEKHRHSLK